MSYMYINRQHSFVTTHLECHAESCHGDELVVLQKIHGLHILWAKTLMLSWKLLGFDQMSQFWILGADG